MTTDLKWLAGSSAAISAAFLGWMLAAQASVDERQDSNIQSVRDASDVVAERQEAQLTRFGEQQARIATLLAEVAATLKVIDERGTKAFLDSRNLKP